MNELISVIIPMYNVEDYIEQCLDSIIYQTYKNIEIILVNDGSFDNTLYICEKYAKHDDRIKIFTQKNKGVSSARNAALKNINGKYFLFVDSDDFIAKDHISNLYNHIIKNNSDICIGTYTEIVSNDFNSITVERFHKILNNDDAILRMVYHEGFGGESVSKLFSSSLIKEYQILFDTKQKIGEDFNFCCLMFKYAKSICYCEEKNYFYQRRKGSATKGSILNSLNRVRSAKVYEEFILNNYKHLYNSTLYYYTFCYLEVINNILDNKNINKHRRLLKILKIKISCNSSKLFLSNRISTLFKIKLGLAIISITLYNIFRIAYFLTKKR